MELIKLTEADFDQVFFMMEEAFPVTEMRRYQEQKKLLEIPKYHLMGYKKHGELLGFFAYWEILHQIYIEHFAVALHQRGHGLGETLLHEFQKKFPQGIFLEVEPPEGKVEKGRIAFYERMGFVFNPFDYMQPPMRTDTKSIPLKIMSSAKEMKEEAFMPLKKELFQMVYSYFGE